MTQGKRRLSPSKAIWCVGDKVDTTYESSCARYVTWERRFEKDANVHDLYKSIGDIDEARYAARLTQAGTPFVREQEFVYPIKGSTVTIEGRYDFKLTTAAGPVIVEKKSITSANRAREIIEKGNIDAKQLAQLVTYMAVHKIPTGKLVSTFWKWGEDLESYVVDGEREFSVEITPTGSINVDGAPYPRHLRDLQRWYQVVAKGMDEADVKLPDRPLPKAGWQNPCAKCPLSASCDAYDRTKDVQNFWQETAHIEPRPGKPAEIIAPKLKKGKKNEQVSNSIDTSIDTGRIQDKTGKHRWEVDS
jgi:hypothetical protein